MAMKIHNRVSSVNRNTNETKIKVVVNLDGKGKYSITTGLPFFDHMIQQLSKHSLIDIDIKCKGDLEIDSHHTMEDVGWALGEAINEAGLVVRKHLKKKKKSPVKLVEGEHDWKKDLNSKNLTESLTSLAKKYPKTAEALKNKGITPENAPKKIEDAGKKVLKKGHNTLTKLFGKN